MGIVGMQEVITHPEEMPRGSRARVIVKRARTVTVSSSFPGEISADAHPTYPGPGGFVSWDQRFRSCLTFPCSLLSLWHKVAQYGSDLHYSPHGSVSDCTKQWKGETGDELVVWSPCVRVYVYIPYGWNTRSPVHVLLLAVSLTTKGLTKDRCRGERPQLTGERWEVIFPEMQES